MTEELNRIPAGRLNGIHAPVGTVLGPKEVTREYVVVTSNDDRGVTVGYAQPADIEAVLAVDHEVRSVAEHLIRKNAVVVHGQG